MEVGVRFGKGESERETIRGRKIKRIREGRAQDEKTLKIRPVCKEKRKGRGRAEEKGREEKSSLA